MEGEIVIKRWEDLDGEVSSYRLDSTFNLDTSLFQNHWWVNVEYNLDPPMSLFHIPCQGLLIFFISFPWQGLLMVV